MKLELLYKQEPPPRRPPLLLLLLVYSPPGLTIATNSPAVLQAPRQGNLVFQGSNRTRNKAGPNRFHRIHSSGWQQANPHSRGRLGRSYHRQRLAAKPRRRLFRPMITWSTTHRIHSRFPSWERRD